MLFLWNGSYMHCLFVFLYLTEVTFPVHRQQSAKQRTGMQAQMGFLLMVIYKTVESNTYAYPYLFFPSWTHADVFSKAYSI